MLRVGQDTSVALVRRGEHRVGGVGQPPRLVSKSVLEYTLHKSTSRHRSAHSKAAEKLTQVWYITRLHRRKVQACIQRLTVSSVIFMLVSIQDLKKAERKAALLCGVSAHAVRFDSTKRSHRTECSAGGRTNCAAEAGPGLEWRKPCQVDSVEHHSLHSTWTATKTVTRVRKTRHSIRFPNAASDRA